MTPKQNDFWIQTYSGKRFSYEDPQPSMITLEDIAVPLSREPRFSGHGSENYSVLSHLLLIETFFDEVEMRLHALLHDAHEAYMKDLPTPLKAYYESFFPGMISELAGNIDMAIYAFLGERLPSPDQLRQIRYADEECLNLERQMLMLNTEHEWDLPLRPIHPRLHRKFYSYVPEVAVEIWMGKVTNLIETLKVRGLAEASEGLESRRVPRYT